VGPEAAQGLCPACLLQEGLRDSQAATLASGVPGSSPAELAELGRLFPQLEVLELVGRGGMGVVYKARQRGLDRLVALKILPPEVDRDPGFRERFVREARALARLTHPNIVAVYDFGQVEGRYYFLMEFVDGANLRKMLHGGHLKPQEAMAIVPQLCDALQFAHEEGIVHRDIKPENILLDRKGRVKIADFGLAKLLGASVQKDPYTLTMPRQVLGTPHYMAPEQFERPGTVDHRADIYSMGVVFYEMLTGELPLGRFPVPSRKVQVDVRLDDVVLRTLEKEPEHRYQRAGDVKTELQSMATLPADGGPPTWSARAAGPSPAWNPVPAGGPARISKMALAGLLAALPFPFALFVCVMGMVIDNGPPPMPEAAVIGGGLTALGLGILCGVLSCAMGLDALRRIRRSAGRIYGLKLALTDALLYPLLLLDAVIVFIGTTLIEPGPAGGDKLGLFLVLVGLGVDWYLVRRIWRKVSVPLAPAPAAQPAPPLPARPAQPPSHYALAPKRKLGCLIVSGIIAAIVFLIFVGICVPIYVSRRARMAPAPVVVAQGYVSADPSSDTGGSPRMAHAYRFRVHSPMNMKTTLWAEIWRDGKIEATPGFPVTQWIIPPRGQGFDGYVTLKLGAPEKGQIDAEWDISGSIGSTHAEHLIPDPFLKTTVTDGTWGPWGGTRTAALSNRLQLLAIRGSKNGVFEGTLTTESAIGRATGEIRLFARFDGLTGAETQGGTTFGESETPPGFRLTSPPRPPTPSQPAMTQPDSFVPDAQPPAIRGTAAEGIAR
jgi:predicted Ser/Thr protein kinase